MTALRILSLLTLLALIGTLSGCDIAGDDPPLEPAALALSPLAEGLAEQSGGFGTELFSRVAAGDDGNLMLSPLSAHVALTMLLNGADGGTAAQIQALLNLPPEATLAEVNAAHATLRAELLGADPEVQIAMANAVFENAARTGGHPIKAAFLEAMREGYGARVDAFDFGAPEALGTVNGWASENTNGRVPEVLAELDPDLVLLLMDALYFKGDWSTPFERSSTAPGDFTLADGSTVQVPMMSGRVEGLTVQGEGYAGVELPYGRRNFSMVLLTPEASGDGTPAPLAPFAARLADGLWDEVTASLDARTEWAPVEVRLPRFSFSTDKTLNAVLQEMGMTDAFTRAANLSRLSDDPRLQVSFVKQNTFVEVNEEGTEAAAVTTVGVVATSLGPHFFADRPFVFAIRERTTNTLLFIGQVARP